jgi:hypothetical protein
MFSLTINDGARGMELSDLCNFNGKLYSFDDRTGLGMCLLSDSVGQQLVANHRTNHSCASVGRPSHSNNDLGRWQRAGDKGYARGAYHERYRYIVSFVCTICSTTTLWRADMQST